MLVELMWAAVTELLVLVLRAIGLMLLGCVWGVMAAVAWTGQQVRRVLGLGAQRPKD